MGLPYKAKTVALYFLELGESEGIQITHMKLQKLIYFAHGWCLALLEKPLIQESIEAWNYGPVIDNIYYWLRSFRSSPIDLRSLTVSIGILGELEDLKKDLIVARLISKVWDAYKDYDALELSKMTHVSMSPWAQARHSVPTYKFNVTIDDKIIRNYFSEQVVKNRVKTT